MLGNYDFSVLSPDEFELLCKDLLEVERDIKLENFKAGKDGGIDLRYTSYKGDSVIIQCKRYDNFNSLKGNLKKEVAKVRVLSPSKYIIMTSVGLSPANKKYILELFEGYIKSTSDILGEDELKAMLGNHKSIERKHYKLWLSSTNILQSIVNNNILNRSEFTEQQIKDRIKRYVPNESFSKAREILNENSFLILSGNPGVGKTTLAEMLSYNSIAKGYKIYEISENIEEAEKVFVNDEKQIFYYDDFLGRNFLEKNLTKNEDKRLLSFINKIIITKNKKLIMTTREYILRQAQQKYDLLKDKRIALNKHIINVESYNKFIKAKILYNHLFFSDIPYEYVQKLVEEKVYRSIIEHKNYNPRIIDLMTTKLMIESIKPTDYFNEFLQKLDYPNDIWEHVFENQIEESSQYIVLLLMILEESTKLKKLEKNFNFLNKNLNNKFHNRSFKNGIKELEKTFIVTHNNYYRNNEIYVSFQNPSIKDFLITYSSQDDSIIELLWDTALFLRPLLKSFSLTDSERKIKVSESLVPQLVSIVAHRFEEFDDCNEINSKLSCLRILLETFAVEKFHELKELIVRVIKDIEKPCLSNTADYLFIIKKYEHILASHINYYEVLLSIVNNVKEYKHLADMRLIKRYFPDVFEKIKSELDLKGTMENILQDTIEDTVANEEYINEEDLSEVINTFSNLSDDLGIDLVSHLDQLEELLSEIKGLRNYEPDDDYIDDRADTYLEEYYERKEDQEIDMLFDTLDTLL